MGTTTPHLLSLNSFVQLWFDESVIAEYEIDAPRLTVGRHPDCDIIIDNAGVSGLHAFLLQERGRFYVKDAMSKNGVMVKGKKANLVELTPNQGVVIAGRYALKLVQTATQNTAAKPDNDASMQDLTPAETMMASPSMLAEMGRQARPAYLTMRKPNGASWILRLNKARVTAGRAKHCDIRTGGWFAPAKLAFIERASDGFYLKIENGRGVAVNGRRVETPHFLKEGDRLQLGKASGVFHERAGL